MLPEPPGARRPGARLCEVPPAPRTQLAGAAPVTDNTHFDVVIIGSGAGGATLAQRLSPSGKKILILERGEHLPREQENWSPKAVFIDKRYRTTEKWWDKRGKPFSPNTQYWVGGNTTFYGAALMRLRKRDFEEVRHGGGVSPAWPISLSDLSPYYDEAETLWEGPRDTRGRPDRDRRRARLRVSRAGRRSRNRAAALAPGSAELEALPPAGGHQSRRQASAHKRLHPLQDLRRLPLSRAGEIGRAHAGRGSDHGPAERHPPDRAQGGPARHGHGGDHRHGRRMRHCAGRGDVDWRHRSPGRGRSEYACDSLGRRTTRLTPTGSPTDRIRSGATICSTR